MRGGGRKRRNGRGRASGYYPSSASGDGASKGGASGCGRARMRGEANRRGRPLGEANGGQERVGPSEGAERAESEREPGKAGRTRRGAGMGGRERGEREWGSARLPAWSTVRPADVRYAAAGLGHRATGRGRSASRCARTARADRGWRRRRWRGWVLAPRRARGRRAPGQPAWLARLACR